MSKRRSARNKKSKIVKRVKVTTFEGLPVRDATHSVILHVQPRDISGSKSKKPGGCAAARAIKREQGAEARVHLGRVYVKRGKHWDRYMTPRNLRDEIIAFDRGGVFEPSEVTLIAPVGDHKLGVDHHGRKNSIHSGPSGKNRKRQIMAKVRAKLQVEHYGSADK